MGGLFCWTKTWAAANGVVTNGGLRGVWPPFPEIGRNRPFSPFFCLFRPFPESLKSTWEIQKTEEKGLFPQISSDFLKPPSLKPPFAAPQKTGSKKFDPGIRVQNSGYQFFIERFVSQSSAPNSDSGGAKSPVQKFPKDPAVLKTLRDSELLRRSVFTTPAIFTTL